MNKFSHRVNYPEVIGRLSHKWLAEENCNAITKIMFCEESVYSLLEMDFQGAMLNNIENYIGRPNIKYGLKFHFMNTFIIYADMCLTF